MGNTCCQCLGRSREESYKMNKKVALPIQDDVLKMLYDLHNKMKPEDFLQVLFFLSRHCVKEKGKVGQYLKKLESAIGSPEDFKKNVEQIQQETKKEENESVFRRGIQDLVKKDLNQLAEGSGALKKTPKDVRHFLGTLSRFPEDKVRSLLAVCQKIGGDSGNQQLTEKAFDAFVSLAPYVKVGLALTYLSFKVVQNINSWWVGEITGTVCVKNIIDCVAGVAAGLAGGFGGQAAGAAIGSIGGPLGALVGGAIGTAAGGLIGYQVGKSLSDMLTQRMFGLSKEKALENAYKFLGASANASDREINSCYRKMARKYHPDKGGDRKQFAVLQCSLEVIRASRYPQN